MVDSSDFANTNKFSVCSVRTLEEVSTGSIAGMTFYARANEAWGRFQARNWAVRRFATLCVLFSLGNNC